MAKHVIKLFESGLSLSKYSATVDIPKETLRRHFAATGLTNLAKTFSKGKPRTLSDKKKEEVIKQCASVALKQKSIVTKAGVANHYLSDYCLL